MAALGNFFSRFVVQVLGNALLLLGVLILLFTIDWRVGAALTAFALFALAVANRLRNVATPHWAATRQANADLFGFIEERLSGTEDLRSSGATAYVMRRLHERARALFSVEQRRPCWAWPRVAPRACCSPWARPWLSPWGPTCIPPIPHRWAPFS